MDLDNRNVFSHSSGDWKPKIKVLADLISGEGSLILSRKPHHLKHSEIHWCSPGNFIQENSEAQSLLGTGGGGIIEISSNVRLCHAFTPMEINDLFQSSQQFNTSPLPYP